jgi:biopolymer transport protein ExbB/TolQ
MKKIDIPSDVHPSKSGNSEMQIASLSWSEEDIENRFGFFKGGRYTSVNKILSFLIALVLTTIFFAFIFFATNVPALKFFADVFVRPGNIYTVAPTMLFFFWAMAILILKNRKIKFQARALDVAAVPQQPDFILNEKTAKVVLERLQLLVDHPRHFLLLNRVDRALSSLHNIGGLSDVSTIMKSQADNDEAQIAASYNLVSGMVWAIPVLGFIGTVQGLSSAIGNFTTALQTTSDVSAIKSSLQGVTGGLSTAFETTLVALVAALFIQLYVNFTQQKETDFLDECNEYCHSHVIAKLRLASEPQKTELVA